MLAKIIQQITYINNDEKINLENYMEGLNFINTVYNFINKIKMIVPVDMMIFHPSFKGRLTCEKFNINSDITENEMRYFVVESVQFLEDKQLKKEQIRDIMSPICESIDFDGMVIRFILKGGEI